MTSTAQTNAQSNTQSNTQSDTQPAKPRRPHLYELDVLRATTALAVVAVHVVAFTVLYNTTTLGALIQHGAEATLHYTREVFMFTTALVLVYSYGSVAATGKRFDLKTFWRKRGIGVVVPYVIWSLIYVLSGPHAQSLPLLIGQMAVALVTGNASFQLYYILLTIQFYVLFPVLLRWLPAFDRHRWLVLGVSGGVELLVLALDYHLLQAPPFGATPVGAFLTLAQDRFVLLYQFYFILGALCALHLQRIRALALRHGRLIALTSVVMLLIYWAHYAYSVGVTRVKVDYAVSVLQPIMVPYSVVVIAFLWWAACRWANGAAGTASGTGVEHRPPQGSRFWRTLADASFGIYLVHPIFMTLAMSQVIPLVPSVTPEPVRVALIPSCRSRPIPRPRSACGWHAATRPPCWWSSGRRMPRISRPQARAPSRAQRCDAPSRRRGTCQTPPRRASRMGACVSPPPARLANPSASCSRRARSHGARSTSSRRISSRRRIAG